MTDTEGLTADQMARPAFHTSETKLWAAVLEEEVRILFKLPGSSMHRDSVAWLAWEGIEVGSFAYVCEVLGLDPTATRRRLIDLLTHRAPVKVIRPYRRLHRVRPLRAYAAIPQ